MTILEILSEPNLQVGIFFLILVAMLLNFIIKLVLIREGIYKKVYKQKRIDWEKFKGGVILAGMAGLILAGFRFQLGFLTTVLAFFIFIGMTQILSSLFLSRKNWKSHKYWD